MDAESITFLNNPPSGSVSKADSVFNPEPETNKSADHLKSTEEFSFIQNIFDNVDVSLSDKDIRRLESLQRALDIVRQIPDKIQLQQDEFNEQYLESLSQRLGIYQKLGAVADPRDFLLIAQEALKVAQEYLKDTNSGLGPNFSDPRLLEQFLLNSDNKGGNDFNGR